MVSTDLATFAQRVGLAPDSSTLAEALTHSSYAAEHNGTSNERLEFLGDAVLDLVVAEHVVATYPNFQEGPATVLKARVVNEEALAAVARSLDIGSALKLGRGVIKEQGYDRPSLLADAFEAVVAAIYLDAGYGAARDFILGALGPTIAEEAATADITLDPKTKLRKWALAEGYGEPVYTATAHGPSHDVTFVVTVVAGPATGTGEARAKKRAELAAAQAAWEEAHA